MKPPATKRPTAGAKSRAAAATTTSQTVRPRRGTAHAVRAPEATETSAAAIPEVAAPEPPESAAHATPAAAEQVLIEVDPHVAAGFINNRYDLDVRGWIVSSVPVEEVALHHEGVVTSRVQYGPPGPGARVTLADGTIVTRQVFTLSLLRSRTAASGPCDITIVVRTASGLTHRQPYALSIDPLLPTQVRVRSGPTRPSAEYAGELTPVVLFVERAALDDTGFLQLVGWAVSMSPLVAIQVFADEERVSSPRLGTRRDDVANAYPSYPNALHAGFLLSTPLSDAAREATGIRAQAICANGFAHEVVVPLERVARIVAVAPAPVSQPPAPAPAPAAAPPVAYPDGMTVLRQDPVYRLVAGFSLSPDVMAVAGLGVPPSAPVPEPAPVAPPAVVAEPADPRRAIMYFCDVTSLTPDGEVAVEGWAVCALGIASVEIWLDEQHLGNAELGQLREDVGDQHPAIPMARLGGFRFNTRIAPPAEGDHRLRVLVRNSPGDSVEDVTGHMVERPKAPPVIEAPPEFRFEIDSPSLADGKVVEPVTGRLTIEGWVLSRSGVSEMVVFLDDQRLGEAHCGLARQDVGNAFPDWPNSLRSGYAFHCPPRSLRNGAHTVTILVRAQNGEEMRRGFQIDVRKPEGSDETVSIRRRVTLVETNVLTEVLAKLDHHPSFLLALRQNGPIEPAQLVRTLASLGSQAYRDWRMVALAEDTDSATAIRACLAGQPAEIMDRVTVIDAGAEDSETAALLDTPFGAIEMASQAVLFGLLCPGDELGADALLEFAVASGQVPTADLLYADEIRISPVSREREVFGKPDFSPDLLLSTNYIGRPWFATPAVLAKADVTPRALLRDAEYDVVLRCVEQAAQVHHVPRLLCRRGAEALDSDRAARAALRRAATRRGIQAEVLETPVPGTFRFRRRKRAAGKVSIIIPTCAAHGHIETCIRTLRDQTAYRNFEIICVDNIPGHQVGWKRWLRDNADKVVDIPEAFNWSRFNNRAAEHAVGEYLLFLNDDIEIIDGDWLDALLDHAQRPEVGVVGARLLYPGGKVQHAGMFLSTTGVARHAFRFATDDEPGYFGLSLTQRNVIAVTGACLLVRREVFDAIGRFDEAHEVVNNDLDFCLRAHQAGLLTVYTPYARLIHHELASRDQVEEQFDTSHFDRQWKSLFTAGDPYFSPLLSRHADDYRPDDEPVEAVYAGHPLFRPEDIKRILVVKLDHIGDFITALPAMRRLKHHFPMATIHVLAAAGARDFAETEPCIDGFIEFAFFHARSGLGQKDLTEEDYADLRARLLPYGFDLAIDLRKHADTREALKHVPARFLAGFDHMGQFTFLDVALEWEGDKNLHRKRGHVTDDLINLVEAVGTAALQERTSVVKPTWPAPDLPGFLSDETRALFVKPVVAVHPGVGTVMRQWPARHFAALIDLLIDKGDVNVVIVGGPDEVELADEVLEQVVNRNAVASVTGRTSLSQLGVLLASCALYVGNNSGPKHIAAAIGVPTIGVHSGVIDPVEWAPIGKRALALRRNMTCSPCYLARLEDCPRNLACLRQFEPVSVWLTCQALLATSRAMVPTFALPEEPVTSAVVAAATDDAEQGEPAVPAMEEPPTPAAEVTDKPVSLAAPEIEPAPRQRKRRGKAAAEPGTPADAVAGAPVEAPERVTPDPAPADAEVAAPVAAEPPPAIAPRSRARTRRVVTMDTIAETSEPLALAPDPTPATPPAASPTRDRKRGGARAKPGKPPLDPMPEQSSDDTEAVTAAREAPDAADQSASAGAAVVDAAVTEVDVPATRPTARFAKAGKPGKAASKPVSDKRARGGRRG